MKTRSELREVIMKVLYQVFLYRKNKIDVNLESIINEQLDGEDKFVSSLVNGVISKKVEIDEEIVFHDGTSN